MNPQNYLAGILVLWVLPACSLVRSPDKTLEHMRGRFAETAMEAAAKAKLLSVKERDLEAVEVDPGRVGVGDLVVLGPQGKMEPVFSIERTVEADAGLTAGEKAYLIQKTRRIMSHRTSYQATVEVSRRELGKVENVDGLEKLKEMREEFLPKRAGMRFVVEGGIEELKASVLEEVYARVGRGKFGGVVAPGLKSFEAELKRQLELVEARLVSGEAVYAVGRVLMVESVVGSAVVMGKVEEPVLGGSGATAVAAFGRVIVPHCGKSEPVVDGLSGLAEFRRVPRYCWAVSGYEVSRGREGALVVDAKKPMRW